MTRTARLWLALVAYGTAGSLLAPAAVSAPAGTALSVQRVLLLSVDGPVSYTHLTLPTICSV